MSELILAIDVGTQSARAAAIDAAGRILGLGRVAYEPYRSPRPGWAEQDPEVWWGAVADACRALWAGGVDPAAIAGVTLTTQRGTVVLVDEAGTPVRPAIVWLDARRTEGVPPIGGVTGLAFRALGVAGTVARFQAEAEASWLARHEPEVLARAARWLLLSGFLAHRLTGRFADSTACQVGYLPFDFRRQDWAAPGDWKWRAVPIDRRLLPDLVAPTGRLGEVTPAAAAATGIPAGTPVLAAAADRACEALGAGAVDPDVACVGYGTTATVATTHARYVEAIPYVPPYPAAVPGEYSLEFQIYRGFWLVEWFRRELGRETATGPETPADLDRLLAATPPGADGLLHLPYWSPGVRFPGPEARGSYVGLTELHTRAHLYRATIEGLAYGLRDGLERAERRSGVRATSIRLAGAGARGEGIARLTADVFGLPVVVPATAETGCLGAAIDAAVGLGLHPDVRTAAAAMVAPGTLVEPDAAVHARYERLYREAFLGLADALRPTYRAIRDATGFPP